MTDAPTPRDNAITNAVLGSIRNWGMEVDTGDFEGTLRLAGYVVEQGWQPIETAPRDRDVLVYAPQPDRDRWLEAIWLMPEIVCVARWHPDAGFCVCTIRDVTRWRPFPAGPTLDDDATKAAPG